jgi:hypothetical protein
MSPWTDRPRILTFVSESPNPYRDTPVPSTAYGFTGRGGQTARTKIILEELLDALGECPIRPYVVFRVHPTEQAGDYAAYTDEIDEFSSKDDGVDPRELVYASDLTVGMTSMLLLSAALLGRPTLAVLAHPSERDLLPSVRAGVTPAVLTRQALRAILPRLLGVGRMT